MNNSVSKLLQEAVDCGCIIVAESEPMKCSDCGDSAELRPYGKDGALVCFDCGMKDEENARAMFSKRLNGVKHKSGTA